MQNESRYNSLLYSRQFIAGPRASAVQDSWRVTRFGSHMFVSHHPSLAVTSACFEDREVLCLGHIFDPHFPLHKNEDVIKDILLRSRSMEDVETVIRELAGRWILFISLNGHTRMYPDAAGTKQAFYTTGTTNHEMWIASQPGLLSNVLSLTKNRSVLKRFYSHPFKNCWPGQATPYDNIRQLRPNHYLDLQSGHAVRFWPCKDLPHIELDAAANKIRETLSAILVSLSHRRRVAMTLTGGYDTRVLFACTEKIRKTLTFFVVVDPVTPYHDISIPKRLIRQFGLKGEIIRAEKFGKEFYSAYRKNVDEMLWEPGNIKICTFRRYGDDWFVVSGNIAEIGRSWYYKKDGVGPRHITPEILAEVTGYRGNPIATEDFETFLSEIPKDINVNTLDLVLWEYRFGNWASLSLTAYDAVCEVIPVWNCRAVLETALAVEVGMRKEPFHLFRRICELCDPELLKIPFNDSLPTRISKLMNQHVHDGIMRRIKFGRTKLGMKLGGFGPYLDELPQMDTLLQQSQ